MSANIDIKGNVVLAGINPPQSLDSIGDAHITYFLRFERISNKKCYVNLQSQGNIIGGYEEAKIVDLSRRLVSKKCGLVLDIMELVDNCDDPTETGERLMHKTAQKIREICGQVQNAWLGTEYGQGAAIQDSIIDEEEYLKHKDSVLEEAERILASDDPVLEVKKHLDNIIAGEDENKLLVFVLGLTGICEDTSKKTILVALHEAGAGKTWIIRNIASFFYSHTVSHLTKRALNYLGEQLAGRIDDEGNPVPADQQRAKHILFLKELGNIDRENDTQGNASIKMLSVDDGGLTTTYTVRDDDTGRFKTITVHTEPITVFTSSTRTMGEIDDQFVRRYFIFSPDASIKQSFEIERFKVKYLNQLNDIMLGIREQTDMERSRWILKATVELLEERQNAKILVPFYGSIYHILDKTKLRIRGDYDKIKLLIEMFGLLNYSNLPTKSINGELLFIMTPERTLQILRIARQTLIYMAKETEGRVYELLQILKNMEVRPPRAEDSGTLIDLKMQFEIAIKMGGKSRRTILEYFKPLVNMGFVHEEKIEKSKAFRMLMDPDEILMHLSGYKDLSNPDLLEELYMNMIKEANEYFEEREIDFKFKVNAKYLATLWREGEEKAKQQEISLQK